MKTSAFVLGSLLAFGSVHALAQELYEPQQFKAPGPGLTRAQVKQETMRAIHDGEVWTGDIEPRHEVAQVGPPRTRAELKQEVLQARANGELHFGDVDPAPVVASVQPRTRAEVKAEMLAAKAHPDPALAELYRN